MKRSFSFCVFLWLATGVASAQDFIARGKIEFEMKRNIRKMVGDRVPFFPGDQSEYDISYRDLIFSGNKSIYQPGSRKSANNMFGYMSDHSVYTELDTRKVVLKRRFMDDHLLYEDSLRKVKWKFENEVRKIAGWTCRKAVGRIHDSVYVVAFYCPEIIPQGGPELFSGLPGMILGLAIPRYFTTWFATKVEVVGVDEKIIVPPTVRNVKVRTRKEVIEWMFKTYKEGIWGDVTKERVEKEVSQYVLQAPIF